MHFLSVSVVKEVHVMHVKVSGYIFRELIHSKTVCPLPSSYLIEVYSYSSKQYSPSFNSRLFFFEGLMFS